MAFTAADVKNLREMTGVGMMDCKKALTASDGDMDKAVEFLREKGLAASAKKAGRVAAEGMAYAAVIDGVGVVVEVNAETDFVGKNEKFVDFVKGVAATVAANKPADLEALKAADAEGYEIVVDTHGTLLWGESAEDERPLLILTSEQVSKEYLAYLNGKHISWIACGKEHVDLKRACEILAAEFDVKRAAAVGGGHINAGFLAAGLLDEVSILIGAGIDGRGGMQSVFDGLPMERGVTPLKLTSVQQYGSGAVWLRYNVEK